VGGSGSWASSPSISEVASCSLRSCRVGSTLTESSGPLTYGLVSGAMGESLSSLSCSASVLTVGSLGMAGHGVLSWDSMKQM